MMTYGLTIKDETYYEIEANSLEEAQEKALEFWDWRVPHIQTTVILPTPASVDREEIKTISY